ncbi:protein CHLOROPLAST IMPORT APPARATUS 2-like isoform X1 [Typha latifolia]|uniref:protein CHLOROPLAST IMPORT APPARATUS 2-like isoform X1 n=1 Tax=Typha latifolia TaxID=4733 RepID=UPI003C2E49AD
MSSCLSGGGPAYGFDLDIVKSSSSSARSSSPSSTLSESSNSPVTISIKKARAPRKRPNQTYNEAAALLSTVYPNIFSTKNLVKMSKHTILFDSFHESSELLPPIPVVSDAAFLIREPSPEKPCLRIESKATSSLDKSSPISSSSPSLVSNELSSPASSTVTNEMWEPNSPGPLEDDFDAESILDEEVEVGIDSIMGNLSMNTSATTTINEDSLLCNSITNPYIQSLVGLGLGSKLELGLRFRYRGVMRQALRHRDDGCCWNSPTVPMKNILPELKMSTPPPSDKKKKKKAKKEVVDLPSPATANTTQPQGGTKAGLGLKLNHEDILKAWSDRGSMFAGGAESPNSSANALAKLADIDLTPENGAVGGVREACVMRYKEKRRTRLFSKKIRYQVRKVNADQRPRMKASGRFVRRPSLLQETIDEESQ